MERTHERKINILQKFFFFVFLQLKLDKNKTESFVSLLLLGRAMQGRDSC
jgi:hypothetical protein